MASGGKREGAGRKAGTPNKPKVKPRSEFKPRKLSAERLAAQLDVTPEKAPLAFLLAVMRDELMDKEGQPIEVKFSQRLTAAIQAAPYVHPRLASVEVKGDPAQPLTIQSEIGKALAELAERARGFTINGKAEAIDLEPSSLPSPDDD
jgi:hypothetical protein